MRSLERFGRFALTLAFVLAVCTQTDLVGSRSSTPGVRSISERGLVMAQPLANAPSTVVDPCSSYASVSGTYLLLCPQGDGLTEDNFIVVNVCLRDAAGTPIPGIAPEDIRLAGCEGGIGQCAIYTADSTTNTEGRTTITISQSLSEPHWGGCDLGGLSVEVNGETILDPTDCTTPLCLPCSTMTPDLDGDLWVGITDFSDFALSYNKSLGDPSYDRCADFLFPLDDWVDLREFALFAAHWEHACGAASTPSASATLPEWPADDASGLILQEFANIDFPVFAVYFDAQYERNWAECPDAPAGTVLDTLYVVLHNANQWVRAVEYRIELPPELLWISDDAPEDPLTIGSSPTGIALAWQTPRNGFEPLLVQTIAVMWTCSGCGPSTNVPLYVWNNPSGLWGDPYFVDSGYQMFLTGTIQCRPAAHICPDATCDISPVDVDFGAVPVGAVKDTTLLVESTLALNVDLFETCQDFSTTPSDTAVHFDGLCVVYPESLLVAVRFEPTVEGNLSCIIPTGDCGDITLEGVGVIRTTWYVDLANVSGPWFGTPANPFRTVADAYAAAADGDSIIVRAGTYAENIIMTKQLRIEAEGGVVRIGGP